jgi:type I restriction enzyme S subunit
MKRFRLDDSIEHISESAAANGSCLVEPETLLFVIRGMILLNSFPVGIVTRHAAFNQDIKAVVCTEEIDPYFLGYWLTANSQRILRLASESTHGTKRFELNDLRKVEIMHPLLAEQQCIARILTTLDELIDTTESVITKHHAIKKGVMCDLFSRGVDKSGRLRPSQADAPDLYQKSELGWVPKDWWVASIGELFDKRTEHGRPGLPVMSIVMGGGLVERSSVDRRVESNLPPEGHALVLKGDIAYNMMRMWQGVLGRAAFDCLVSPAYVVLKPKATINTHFAAHLFSDDRSIIKFRQLSQGVVDDRLRLYFHDLVKIKFAVPKSPDEQQAIADRIEACDSAIAKEDAVLEQYKYLRTGLMQDLLTGKVRVNVEAEEVAARG